MPLTVSYCGEKKLIKFKVTKHYLRASVGEKRLTNMSIMPTDHKVAKTTNIDALTDKFSSLKLWKLPA
jgi:hypothetical protein